MLAMPMCPSALRSRVLRRFLPSFAAALCAALACAPVAAAASSVAAPLPAAAPLPQLLAPAGLGQLAGAAAPAERVPGRAYAVAGSRPPAPARRLQDRLSAEEIEARRAFWQAASGGELPAAARRAPRIVGGSRVPITAVPWQVAVWSYTDGAGGDCGGTIIDRLTIVTAAHCVDTSVAGADPFTGGGVGVLAGVQYLGEAAQPGEQPQARIAVKIRIHPSWRGQVHAGGDLAVLTLNEPLVLDGTTARAALLPAPRASDNGDPLPVGIDAIASGFGNLSGTTPTDGFLYQTVLKTVTPIACGSAGADNATTLCATSPSSLVCSGDSGGPLVQGTPSGPVLIGVTSNGPTDCTPGTWAAFADLTVPEHRLFLDGNDAPPLAPRQTAPIEVHWPNASRLRSGEKITCKGGAWTGAPGLKWYVVRSDGAVVATGTGPELVYEAGSVDVGARLICVAFASNAGGTQIAGAVEVPLTVEQGYTGGWFTSVPKSVRRGRTFTASLVAYNVPASAVRGDVWLRGARWRAKTVRFTPEPDAGWARDVVRVRVRIVMPRSARRGSRPWLRVRVRFINAQSGTVATIHEKVKVRAR